MPMSEPLVLVAQSGAVQTLTLNRPAALNSFTTELHAQLLHRSLDARQIALGLKPQTDAAAFLDIGQKRAQLGQALPRRGEGGEHVGKIGMALGGVIIISAAAALVGFLTT